MRITLLMLLALLTVGCAASGASRTPGELADQLADTQWVRPHHNDTWNINSDGTATTTLGVTGRWRAIDSNTILLWFNSFYAVTFDQELTRGEAQWHGGIQEVLRQ